MFDSWVTGAIIERSTWALMRRELSAGDGVTERTFCAALAERWAIGSQPDEGGFTQFSAMMF